MYPILYMEIWAFYSSGGFPKSVPRNVAIHALLSNTLSSNKLSPKKTHQISKLLFDPLSAIAHYIVHFDFWLFIVLDPQGEYLGTPQSILPCVTRLLDNQTVKKNHQISKLLFDPLSTIAHYIVHFDLKVPQGGYILTWGFPNEGT